MYTSPKVDASSKLRRCFLRRSTGQTARFMTLSPTSWSDCSALTSTWRSRRCRPVGWVDRCSFLRQLTGRIVRRFIVRNARARQLRWGLLSVQIVRRFIVSRAGGSLAELGTPRRLDSSCKRRQLTWGLPWWSDLATSHRCAIKLLHAVRIRVLILGSTSGVL